MPRYARFDPAVADPKPVVGWYDTDLLTYAALPDMASLFVLTNAQWDARMTGLWAISGGALVAYVPENQMMVQSLMALTAAISKGIAITCTSTPSLNATYALDTITMGRIGPVARDTASGIGLPGGLSTFTFPDINSAPHVFTAPQIISLYQAQRDLMLLLVTAQATMGAGGTPVWPTQSATIP